MTHSIADRLQNLSLYMLVFRLGINKWKRFGEKDFYRKYTCLFLDQALLIEEDLEKMISMENIHACF